MKKILVVDDDPQIVRLLELRLKANNFEVICGYDGFQCVQMAEEELPNLIVLDIKMPLRGGINAFEILKSTLTTEHIPVIFITAFPSPEVRKQAMALGAADFISKPFKSELLIEKINAVLNAN